MKYQRGGSVNVSGLIVLATAAALALVACVYRGAPVTGYAAVVYGFIDGKIELAQVVGETDTLAHCKVGIAEVVKQVQAQAPPGGVVAGACYPIPLPPTPVASSQIVPDSTQKQL